MFNKPGRSNITPRFSMTEDDATDLGWAIKSLTTAKPLKRGRQNSRHF
jgi:hypothetical protein